jgi:ABC-type transporter Mla MlaB component
MEMDRDEDCGKITYTIKGSLAGLNDEAVQMFGSISQDLDAMESTIDIDLEKVSFTDSLAIGLLTGVLLKAGGLHRTVKMVKVPDHIRSLFETLHLRKAFPEAY